jgi:hypothetical protein
LCATVQRNPDGNERLRAFAEQVASAEVQILLRRALERAGYYATNIETTAAATKVSSSSSSSQVPDVVVVDETRAVLAMKPISSAHLSNFLADGWIVLRRVVNKSMDPNNDDQEMVSAAAGVACRLLQSAGCKFSTSDAASKNAPAAIISVRIPTTEAGASALGTSISKRVGDISTRDGFAFLQGKDGQNSLPEMEGVRELKLEACTKEDLDALFVDPFFGTRGETPTTVIQWSKGTIF